MCAEAGIEPILTTTAQWGDAMNREGPDTCCSADDMADLIDYTWGGASTEWGAKRIAEGHPEPYKVKYIELGNEQYNTLYPAQVKAMEERATKLGKPKFFYYMSPNNARWLNSSQATEVEALGLGDHVMTDEHVGAGGGVEVADNLFNNVFPGKTMGAGNAETNDGTHTMLRAVKEAADLNDWFSCSAAWCSRLKFRTASFCNERSGHFDAFDQGISFFLPNMTWLQPPGYVHKMFADTWQPNALNVTVTPAGGGGGTRCGYYAFFSDKGCRTWPEATPCAEAPWSSSTVSTTLHNRSSDGKSFSVIGTDKYCTNDPSFEDGPAMTPTDDACKAKCIAGAAGPPGPATITASAQQSEDGSQVVVRLTNMASTVSDVVVRLGGRNGQGGGKEMGMGKGKGKGKEHEALFEFEAGGNVDAWTLASASCDQMAANTPSEPEKVSPVHTVVSFNGTILLPCSSVVVLRINSTAAAHAHALL
jgi:hypothetical protein